jgi:glycosyltransferase involved in cell wall biosynthesis
MMPGYGAAPPGEPSTAREQQGKFDQGLARMRIIYHQRTRLRDAQGIHVRAIVRAFQELGHEVEIVSAVDGASELDAAGESIEARRLPSWLYEMLSLAYNLYGYRQLARAVRQRGADLIYERYALNSVCGVLASRRFGVPLLLEVNAPWHDHAATSTPIRFRRLARRLQRWVCSNSAHTIVVSAALKEFLVQEGVPERQITVMHNAVDPRVFDPRVSGEEVRRRYRLNGHVVAGFIGWIRDWHGLEGLIEAVHGAKLIARGLRLLIVGTGPSFPEVQRRMRAFGLEDGIILAGPVAHAEVPAHIAALDIALQPRATAYACPMKLVEYMAMGRCIVAPNQPNIRELVRDGVNARLFPPENYGRAVELIAELVNSPAERTILGCNAQHTVRQRCLTWRGNASCALGLLTELEGRSPGGPRATAHSRGSSGHAAVR